MSGTNNNGEIIMDDTMLNLVTNSNTLFFSWNPVAEYNHGSSY